MGWTMAFGTARIVGDLIAGRKPDHDPTGLTPRPVAGGQSGNPLSAMHCARCQTENRPGRRLARSAARGWR